jgi:hypothetical protein
MNVRAKFQCVSKSPNGDGANIELNAAIDDQNKTWAHWTPGGQILMTIDNPSAAAGFEVGKSYFVDFTPAPATEAEET